MAKKKKDNDERDPSIPIVVPMDNQVAWVKQGPGRPRKDVRKESQLVDVEKGVEKGVMMSLAEFQVMASKTVDLSSVNGLRLSYQCRRHEEIKIGEEEVHDARLMWRNVLVGNVVGLKLSFSVMDRFVTMLGKGIPKPKVLLHESGFFLYKFAFEGDKLR
ncbi:hypothetical protein Droror1_Dr00026716, partial [Drosera rotundifolia]